MRWYGPRVLSVVAVLGVSAVALTVSPECVQAHDDFDERIERANRRIAAEPSQAEGYLRRAELYRHHRDWDDALADLDRAAELNPDLPHLELLRGLVLLKSKHPVEAEAALRRFLARSPDHPPGLAAHAKALDGLGRHLEAARDLDRAVEHQPVPTLEYYLDRAQALADAGDEHLDEALRGLDQALEIMGPIVNLQRAAIELELRRGDIGAAIARLDGASDGAPRHESWLVWRGEILERAGRESEALASYRLALAQLDGLPAHRRGTTAATRLEATIRRAIERLSLQADQPM